MTTLGLHFGAGYHAESVTPEDMEKYAQVCRLGPAAMIELMVVTDSLHIQYPPDSDCNPHQILSPVHVLANVPGQTSSVCYTHHWCIRPRHCGGIFVVVYLSVHPCG